MTSQLRKQKKHNAYCPPGLLIMCAVTRIQTLVVTSVAGSLRAHLAGIPDDDHLIDGGTARVVPD